MKKKRKTEKGGGWRLNDSKYNPVNKITHVTGYEITTLYPSNTITS